MKASLIFVNSDGESTNVTLDPGTHRVGRQHGQDIRVPIASISRNHCEIEVDADSVRVHDLGSSNGTYVNGERVESAGLGAGDIVAVGSVFFVVQIDGEPASVDVSKLKARTSSVSASQPSSDAAAPTTTTSISQSLLDDLDDELGSNLSNDDSSVADFDFSLEDDDLDDQPEL